MVGLFRPRQGLSARETHIIGWLAPAVLCAIAAVAIFARRAIFFLPAEALREITLLHLARILVMNAVAVAQWMVVMPDQPWRTWWTLLAVSNLVGRLPSLFSNNLIFVAAGIGLSGGLELPTATLAGTLLASTALDKLMNMTIFLGTTLAGRYHRRPVDGPSDAGTLPAGDADRPTAAEDERRAA